MAATSSSIAAAGTTMAKPPRNPRDALAYKLFGDMFSAAATLVTLALALYGLQRLIDWGVLSAVWPGGSADACRQASGACWAFLTEKFRLILFGIYPPEEQWRPILVCVFIAAMTVYSINPSHWRRGTALAWIAGIVGAIMLMHGRWLGLAMVPPSSWGGLPVTLLLAVCALGAGFPFAVVLALGRRSDLPVCRFLSVLVIETIRGLPLISLLFMASIVLPLLLPAGITIDSLLRAGVALTVFSAAYLAEVIRGGLQAIPSGQMEASRALGLSWWKMTRLIVLPQAVRYVIAPLTNTAIVMVKNTSLVFIVGLFDLLSAARAALTDPAWPTPFAETYLFIAAIYFVICFSLSRYAMWLERRYHRGKRG
ncbi:MAG: amino acid ABC transporter permease [Pusillimonas sp.]